MLMKDWLRSRLAHQVAIDLGTSSTIVSVIGHEIMINEPSVVAISSSDGEVIAIGEHAQRMEGRAPQGVQIIYPMKDGVIADIDAVETMIGDFLRRVRRRKPSRPQVAIGIPSGITMVEKRAIIDACRGANAGTVWTVYESFAAALGAGLPVFSPGGQMVIDIGGGTTEVSVISLGSIVETLSIKVGGTHFIRAIQAYIRDTKETVIGPITAERMYQSIGTALNSNTSTQNPGSFSIRGRDKIQGLPRTLELHSHEVYEAISDLVQAIAQASRDVLDLTPPELASDIIDNGITLTGGGSMLHGLCEFLNSEIHVPTKLANDPLLCVIRGLETYIKMKLYDEKHGSFIKESIT